MDVWAVEILYFVDYTNHLERGTKRTVFVGSETGAEQCAERLSRHAVRDARREYGVAVYPGLMKLRILVDGGKCGAYNDQ